MKKKILVIFIFLLLLIVIDKSSLKKYLIESSVRNIINKQSMLVNSTKMLVSPKNLLYYSLNNLVSKKSLSVYKVEEEIPPYEDYALIEEIKETDPILYIYNTHQTEEYERTNFEYSVKPNVMIASYIFKEHLKKYNITSSIETRSMKEYLNNHNMTYNDSYHASEYYARDFLVNNPSIKYMIDIHRDSITKEISSISIDNKPYTKMMFLMGYEHSKDEYNEGFAIRLHELIESKYKGLSRGVIDRRDYPFYGTYNSNLETISTLVEVGGVDSTLEEVNNSLEALAWAFNEYLKENNND